MGKERVCHRIGILVRPMEMMHVWDRHILLIIPSINLDVLWQAEESRWNIIQDITNGKGFVKIMYVLQ